MTRTIPSHLHRLPPAKLGVTPSPRSVYFKRVAQRNNKEGTLRTHHGAHPTSPSVSTTFQITNRRSQNTTNETGTTGRQRSTEESS